MQLSTGQAGSGEASRLHPIFALVQVRRVSLAAPERARLHREVELVVAVFVLLVLAVEDVRQPAHAGPPRTNLNPGKRSRAPENTMLARNSAAQIWNMVVRVARYR